MDEVKIGNRWISPSGVRFKVLDVDYFETEDEGDLIMLDLGMGQTYTGAPDHLVPLAPSLTLVLGGESDSLRHIGSA